MTSAHSYQDLYLSPCPSVAVFLNARGTSDLKRKLDLDAYLEARRVRIAVPPGKRSSVDVVLEKRGKKREIPVKVELIEIRMAWHERQHADPFHRWMRDLVASSLS